MINLVGRALAIAVPQLPTISENTSLATILGGVINTALYVGGSVAVLYLLYGGFMYTTAGGEAEQATKARTIIVNAIIGIVIVSLALVLVTWATKSLGVVGGTTTTPGY